MKEIKIGKLKFIISNIPDLKGCNIKMPEGNTTAFLSVETLELLLKEVKNMEERRKYNCCQNCGIDADCEIVDQKTGLCQECTTAVN